jgi:hypothetical protein
MVNVASQVQSYLQVQFTAARKNHPKGDARRGAGYILDGESALSKVCKSGASHTFRPERRRKESLFELSATLDGR